MGDSSRHYFGEPFERRRRKAVVALRCTQSGAGAASAGGSAEGVSSVCSDGALGASGALFLARRCFLDRWMEDRYVQRNTNRPMKKTPSRIPTARPTLVLAFSTVSRGKWRESFSMDRSELLSSAMGRFAADARDACDVTMSDANRSG